MSDYENQARGQYTVAMRSLGGPYEQYRGVVKVWATDHDDAIEQAFRELKRGAFPDRSRDMWRVESVTRGGE